MPKEEAYAKHELLKPSATSTKKHTGKDMRRKSGPMSLLRSH